MAALLAAWAAAAAAATTDGDEVAALARAWSGVRDSSEQVVMSADEDAARWPQVNERRVRTIVAPVAVGWLGAEVLYLEEFLEDDPRDPLRQLLLALEPAGDGTSAVRARLYTFVHPHRWTHLNHRAALAAGITLADIAASAGCDLIFRRAGDQFRGGTVGQQCADTRSGVARYLDYQLVISPDIYWYRRRVLRQRDGELEQEIIGFNRFEPNEARLYACRIAWSASGSARDLKPLVTLDLYEQGGRGRFATPDGRAFELTLHGRDWPFAVERDALLLMLAQQGGSGPLASAWAQSDAQQIALELGWLSVRCGSLASESDELAQ